jgi:hypothetical protein
MPNPKGKKPSVRLSISVNGTDHAGLARLVDARDVLLLWVARRAIADFTKRHRNDLQGQLCMPRGRSL